MVDYSATPLSRKLGIKEGYSVGIYGAPAGFETALEPLAPEVALLAESRRRTLDLIVWFVPRQTDLARRLEVMASRIVPRGGLWVAWPKKASGVPTDLDGNLVREAILDVGLVDNKVCSIDATWSALRGVVRLKDR